MEQRSSKILLIHPYQEQNPKSHQYLISDFQFQLSKQTPRTESKHNPKKKKKGAIRENRITRKQCSCRIQHPRTWKEGMQKKTQFALILKRSWHWCPPTQVPHPWRRRWTKSLTLQHRHFFLNLESFILLARCSNHSRLDRNQQRRFRFVCGKFGVQSIEFVGGFPASFPVKVGFNPWRERKWVQLYIEEEGVIDSWHLEIVSWFLVARF